MVPDPKDPKKKITRFQRDLYRLPMTVQFPERTKTGKPAQAKALGFRTYENEESPENTRVQKIMKECA
jgi:hypothetical protein